MARLFPTTLLFSLVCMFSFAQPKTIRVPLDQPTIQEGINAAVDGDTVLVAEGTYNVNLILKKKIVLGSLYIIDGNQSHIDNTILDGSSPRHADSGSVILISTGTDSTTVISGFTIQRGRGTRFHDPSIGRWWLTGGGINIFAGGAKITHNVIRNDTLKSTDGLHGVYGGGISMSPLNGPMTYWVIEDNVINHNVLFTSAPTLVGAEGGGVWLTEDGRFARNIVDSNSSTGTFYGVAGGVDIGASGGYGSTNVQFFSNRVRGNIASTRGGGMGMWGLTGGGIVNVSIVNNLIVGNSAVRTGGGMNVGRNCSLSLINNTIADNFSGGMPGMLVEGTATNHSFVIGINNIFWNTGNWEGEIFGVEPESFHHNLIRGESSIGSGNFSADPKFALDESYRLTAESPCIGGGTSFLSVLGTPLQSPITDLLGGVRPRAGGTSPDIGAFEEDFSTTTAQRPNRVTVLNFMHQGAKRWYSVFRPLGREAEINRPVIIYLHGYDGTGDFDMGFIGLHKHADSAGFLTIYPEAYQRRWNSGINTDARFPTPSVNDVSFISVLIDSLRAQYAIDTNRVFVAGFSNGAFMAFRLAAMLGDRLAGVIANGGRLPQSTINAYSATTRIPIMIVHGMNDVVISYDQITADWSTVEDGVNYWRTKNGASTLSFSGVRNGNPSDGSSVNVYKYGMDLPYNAKGLRPAVWFYSIFNGGHEWPGGPIWEGHSVINRDISLNEEIFDFIGETTGVEDAEASGSSLPTAFMLHQNFPNPFNPSTTIRFSVPSESHVRLTVFNLLGQKVEELVNETVSAGLKQVTWNAQVPTGVYMVQLEGKNAKGETFRETKRMVLAK